MDFTATDTQEAIRGLAAQVFATGVPADIGVAGFDDALWSRLGRSGLLGVALPEHAGGGGLGLAEAAVVAEEAGRAVGRVPVVTALAALRIVAAAAGPQHQALLTQGVNADVVLVTAFSEAGVGDDFAPTVAAQRDADGWLLTGTRLAVAWGREASHLVVSAREESGEEVLLLVPTAGLELIDEAVSSGEPHATVLLDLTRVEQGALLARGSAALESALADVALLHCAYAVGVAEQALQLTATHVSTREQFGKPLATFQAVTCQVADCWIDVEAMRLTMQQAVWRADQGLPASEQTAIAAFWGAEGVQRVVSKAVHLHGGLGVDISYPLHRWFLVSKVVELSLGGAQRQLERLGGLLAAR